MTVFSTFSARNFGKTLLACGLCLTVFAPPQAQAMAPLSKKMIHQAIKYGLMNQEMGLYAFMGYNWQEQEGGTLLNVYTPFIEISRSVARRKFGLDPSPQNIADVKKKVERDINYTWHHPKVKFIVSMFGDSPDFASKYYAVVDGVGKGRKVRLRPIKRVPDFNAQKSPNATEKAYSAVNTYEFDFEAIQKLDEFTLKLFTKEGDSIEFRLVNRRLL